MKAAAALSAVLYAANCDRHWTTGSPSRGFRQVFFRRFAGIPPRFKRVYACTHVRMPVVVNNGRLFLGGLLARILAEVARAGSACGRGVRSSRPMFFQLTMSPASRRTVAPRPVATVREQCRANVIAVVPARPLSRKRRNNVSSARDAFTVTGLQLPRPP